MASIEAGENGWAHKRFSIGHKSATFGGRKCFIECLQVAEIGLPLTNCWPGSCLGMRNFMNSSGHLAVSEATARRVKKAKTHKRHRNRGRNGKNAHGTPSGSDVGTTMAAVGTLTRTKALLLAALRGWELKHRIHE